ncbi:MAG: 50S ribosomal protein L11 methyltransferase, partial [Planctomycetaceae bacterium]|nr:50S ribosomal protein L11 methyltransferase [Planctomycetaceae bacterium]
MGPNQFAIDPLAVPVSSSDLETSIEWESPLMSSTDASHPLNSETRVAKGSLSVGERETEPRFAFGKNWSKFLKLLDEERIQMARASLQQMLDLENLQGKACLDIGSGSGLFSLAAARLGADSLVSFDYDKDSVAC